MLFFLKTERIIYQIISHPREQADRRKPDYSLLPQQLSALCPMEDYIKNNNIKERLSFKEKEVYYHRKNADDLAAKAKICGIPTD